MFIIPVIPGYHNLKSMNYMLELDLYWVSYTKLDLTKNFSFAIADDFVRIVVYYLVDILPVMLQVVEESLWTLFTYFRENRRQGFRLRLCG